MCADCREPYEPGEEELTALATEYLYTHGVDESDASLRASRARVLARWRESFSSHGTLVLYRPGGCVRCEHSGYSGRFAVHELMMNSDSIKRMIQTRAPTSELRCTALGESMRTLRQDGIEKVVQGYTDLSEIRRVCAS
jgi:type II secretory ATPase GspE/PulE/Tfp pilus assembly ATPase PilB-like protein